MKSKFDQNKSNKLLEGFEHGFKIGYNGDRHVQQTANNLNITVGSKEELWNKVMKEVKLKRYAGPFDAPPFNFFIQSPIGLVPKDGGADTRLIFHLSYPRVEKGGKQTSVNGNTDPTECSVSYPDFQDAVQMCWAKGKDCYAGKSDFKSAFRNLGMSPSDWPLLVMKAQDPVSKKWKWFFDKCLPFGGSISCAHFQLFSDAVAHIFTQKTGQQVVNYLDDFFFVGFTPEDCNHQMRAFLEICEFINFPVSMDKTFWAATKITFLGLLIDTESQKVYVPIDKLNKAEKLITKIILKKKARIDELQRLCGLLNFFAKCIVPARAFTRRLYSKTLGYNLKPHHHVDLDDEMNLDSSCVAKINEFTRNLR